MTKRAKLTRRDLALGSVPAAVVQIVNSIMGYLQEREATRTYEAVVASCNHTLSAIAPIVEACTKGG